MTRKTRHPGFSGGLLRIRESVVLTRAVLQCVIYIFEWGLLAHKLSLVPWLASRIGNAGIHVWLLWLGAFSLRFRCLEGIQTRMLSAEAHSRFPAHFESFSGQKCAALSCHSWRGVH